MQEVNLPLWAGRSVSEVRTADPDGYSCWKERPHEFSMALPEGEYFPVLDLRQQADAFWQTILDQHQGETIAIVGHNGINRCLISTAMGIGADRYQGLLQSNCGISVLNFSGGYGSAAQLESMNLTAHLAGLQGCRALPEPSPSDCGPQLLLVRHGETEWNRQGRFQGQIDVPLNENGLAQAQKAAEFLKQVTLDFAFSSPMLRPKATAEAILAEHEHLSLQLLDDLQEISHGTWEGKYEAEIRAEYGDLLDQWQTAPETVQMPEGENLQQVWDRAAAAWAEIVKDGEERTVAAGGDRCLTGLVVAHDAVNKALLCQITGLGPASFWRFKQGNGGVSAICYPNGSTGLPMLQMMNATHHLSGTILDKTAAGAL
ncbi:MAG: histidine phosphatase family protein [Cyanophyceae cyanobacterium]